MSAATIEAGCDRHLAGWSCIGTGSAVGIVRLFARHSAHVVVTDISGAQAALFLAGAERPGFPA